MEFIIVFQWTEPAKSLVYEFVLFRKKNSELHKYLAINLSVKMCIQTFIKTNSAEILPDWGNSSGPARLSSQKWLFWLVAQNWQMSVQFCMPRLISLVTLPTLESHQILKKWRQSVHHVAQQKIRRKLALRLAIDVWFIKVAGCSLQANASAALELANLINLVTQKHQTNVDGRAAV